jgi:hypothetical protein
MTKCPVCGKAALRKEVRKSELYGFDLGDYLAEVCPSCGEVFWQEADVKKMEQVARKLGIWGLEQTTRVGVAGNSLIVRVPKSLARFIGLKKGEAVSVHPLGRDKLLIEETSRTRS